MAEHFLSIALGGKVHRVRFDNRARYRMASLDRPYDLTDLGNPKKAFGALCAWLWACMYEKHGYETPEDLSEHITNDNTAEVGRLLTDAIVMGMPDNTSPNSAKNDSAGNERLHASNLASHPTNGQPLQTET